jgi:hypothetical protein
MSFRRESCIRRGIRHEPVLVGCRIHPETWLPVMRVSRLAEIGRTGSGRVAAGRTWRWIFVGLLLAEHPVACLCEVASDGDDGAAMPLAGREPLIEAFDVGAAISLDPQRAGGGFDESPLEGERTTNHTVGWVVWVSLELGGSVFGEPGCGSKLGDSLYGGAGKSWQDVGEVVADRYLKPTAAFNYR